jgi:hypothetical protein
MLSDPSTVAVLKQQVVALLRARLLAPPRAAASHGAPVPRADPPHAHPPLQVQECLVHVRSLNEKLASGKYAPDSEELKVPCTPPPSY